MYTFVNTLPSVYLLTIAVFPTKRNDQCIYNEDVELRFFFVCFFRFRFVKRYFGKNCKSPFISIRFRFYSRLRITLRNQKSEKFSIFWANKNYFCPTLFFFKKTAKQNFHRNYEGNTTKGSAPVALFLNRFMEKIEGSLRNFSLRNEKLVKRIRQWFFRKDKLLWCRVYLVANFAWNVPYTLNVFWSKFEKP